MITCLLVTILQIRGQVPQKFSYQAVLRNTDGTVIANQTVGIKINLLKESPTGDIVYTETHSTSSNQGIISFSVGEGTVLTGVFDTIPWEKNIYIQLAVMKTGDADYQLIGTTQVLSVPYALRAGNVKEVTSLSNASDEDPIFVVRNKSGEIVFGVYQNGVRINVEGSPSSKGTKGGFAVGGLSSKGTTTNPFDILYVDADSTRIYFNESTSKGSKGGFAVGGLSGSKADVINRDRLLINTDSTRFYINGDLSNQSGGFGIKGLAGTSVANINLFTVTNDSTFFSNTIFTEGNIISTGSISTGGGVASLPLADLDGNVYQTVKIGSQIWMKENLRTTKFSDGTSISTSDIFAYNNTSDSTTVKNYGLLYSGMVMSSQTTNVCPLGWRVPTAFDWDSLMVFVGGPNWQSDLITAGLKLMEPGTLSDGTGFWNKDNSPNNASGFSGRPGGYATGSTAFLFYSMGDAGYWWVGQGTYNYFKLDGSNGQVFFPGTGSVMDAYSVRCVKGDVVALPVKK